MSILVHVHQAAASYCFAFVCGLRLPPVCGLRQRLPPGNMSMPAGAFSKALAGAGLENTADTGELVTQDTLEPVPQDKPSEPSSPTDGQETPIEPAYKRHKLDQMNLENAKNQGLAFMAIEMQLLEFQGCANMLQQECQLNHIGLMATPKLTPENHRRWINMCFHLAQTCNHIEDTRSLLRRIRWEMHGTQASTGQPVNAEGININYYHVL